MSKTSCETSSEFLTCVCGHLEHHAYIEISTWKKDNIPLDCDCAIYIHLAPMSFFSRLWHALKYVFQFGKQAGSYDEIIINRSQAVRIKEFMEKYINFYDELESRKNSNDKS